MDYVNCKLNQNRDGDDFDCYERDHKAADRKREKNKKSLQNRILKISQRSPNDSNTLSFIVFQTGILTASRRSI